METPFDSGLIVVTPPTIDRRFGGRFRGLRRTGRRLADVTSAFQADDASLLPRPQCSDSP